MIAARIFLPLILLGSLLLGGCTTTSARELTVSARNYEARSLEAIAAVETMARREVEVPALPEREAEEAFVRNIRTLSPTQIGQDAIELALNPTAVNVAAQDAARAGLLERMREQHAAFSAIFNEAERAGILGKRTISTRVPPVLDTLIAQQVGLARSLTGDNRPRLLGLRGALAAEIALVLRDMPAADQDAALRDLRRRWLDMQAQEEALLASTSSALLTAAATGLALREQVEAYGSLSLAELQSISRELIGFVGSLTGRDLSALNGQVENLVARINADPDFSAAAKALLTRASAPAASGAGGE